MFGFLKPKRLHAFSDLPRYLPFKSTQAAFEFACRFHSDKVEEGSGHVAIVLDSAELFGVENSVRIQNDGSQIVTLKIANSDGGFIVPSQTPVKNAPPLKPGDLVLWVAGKYLQEMAASMNDKRSGWVGMIYAVLSPEARTDTGAFRVSLDYRDVPC